MTFDVRAIGEIHVGRVETEETPVQTTLNWGEPGEVHLHPGFAMALDGLGEFTHMWVITWLGRPGQSMGESVEMRPVPFLLRPTGEAKGVLATRSPRRPTPIGLHLVRIAGVGITPPIVRFFGVDMVDGTPVLDIKPWVGRFDVPPDPEPRSGWYDRLGFQQKTPAELAGTDDKEE